MTKLSCAEIPFCNNEAYHSLSMQSRCILLMMYHIWLANGRRNVAFDLHFKKLMCDVLSIPDFDYFLLGRNIRTKYGKLCLVTKRQGFVFVLETEVNSDYSKSCKNARSRVQNARPRAQSARFRTQTLSAKPKVLVIETPMHENFMND